MPLVQEPKVKPMNASGIWLYEHWHSLAARVTRSQMMLSELRQVTAPLR